MGGVADEHCPNYNMLAEYFTKPVEGGKFYDFLDRIMGYPQENLCSKDHHHMHPHKEVRVHKATEKSNLTLKTNHSKIFQGSDPRVVRLGFCKPRMRYYFSWATLMSIA